MKLLISRTFTYWQGNGSKMRKSQSGWVARERIKGNKLLILFACTFLSYSLSANVDPSRLILNSKEFVRSVKKEYDINADGEVRLKNEHGKINIHTWDKNRVKVDIKITVYATSKPAADEVFKRIKFNFANNSSTVEAQTTILQYEGWWAWSFGNTKDKYAIDYEVHLPKGNSLKLHNSHGDVTVAAIKGPADMSLDYGNLKLEGVEEDLDLKLSFGTGVILKSKDARVNVNSAKLRFKEAKDIHLTSSYSKIHIEQAGDIRSESTYDTYEVGAVREFINKGKYDNIAIIYADNVEAVSQFTDVKVEKIGNSADFALDYGGAQIATVAKGFSELILIGNYVDYKISLEVGTAYKLNASSEKSGINYPKELIIVYEKDQKHTHDVQGYVGRSKNPKGTIRVKVSNGGLNVN